MTELIHTMRYRMSMLLFGMVMAISSWAQTGYKMFGPYEVIARDGQYRHTKNGSEKDMAQALLLARQGDKEGAAHIIHAYAQTLQRLDGHDAPLCTLQGYDLVQAMIMCSSMQTPEWSAMLRRAFLPVINQFEADSPYANGNWGAIINRMRMACALFLNDSTMYKHAVEYFLYADDNGSLPRYISETGQCQETGRDQAHAQLGLGAMCDICEMAWQQGDDLWGALDNRLMKGIEYSARYNLGYDVPFVTWKDCTGLYNDWTSPGEMSRGKLWSIYQLPYDHYKGRKGLDMPYTRQALKVLRNEKQKQRLEAKWSRQEKHEAFVYQAPQGAPLKHDYDVFVQPRGSKEWIKVDTYSAKVNAPVGQNRHRNSEISYAFFDFVGDVYVKVVCKKKTFKDVRIRPNYKGVIPHIQNDSTVQFLLFQPENVSVEFDGSVTDNLLLFTSRPGIGVEEAREQAKKQQRAFVYFPPGYYNEKDTIRVQSNTTYYLAPGAYFTSTFALDNVENVHVLGRGVARPGSGYEGCHVYRSRHVRIEGLILNTCPIGESQYVDLYDVRSISHPAWGDGLNVFGGCSHIVFDRIFCRNSDDCTTAYATRKGFVGSVHHVTMRNATLWADVAHPIFIGIHGHGSLREESDSIVGLRYENIDILMQAEPQIDYQGCLAINCGDNNVVKDVTFDNIRIEQLYQGSILSVKVGYNRKYCSAPGKSVEDIHFNNIRYGSNKQPALAPNMSIICGYDAEHKVKNISFKGFKINGMTLHDDMQGKPKWYKTADMGNIYVNEWVEHLVFQP